MRWLRLVGTLILQVSFAKEPYEKDDILQKRPIILRSLLIVATPYCGFLLCHSFLLAILSKQRARVYICVHIYTYATVCWPLCHSVKTMHVSVYLYVYVHLSMYRICVFSLLLQLGAVFAILSTQSI